MAARAPEITRSGVPVGDLAGGAYAAMAISAALAGRGTDGAGPYIDVSMADVLLSWAAPDIGGDFASRDDPGVAFPGYGTFSCADGFVTLGVVSEDPFWIALCDALELESLRGLDVAAREIAVTSYAACCATHWPRDDATSWSPSWSQPVYRWRRC